MGVQTALNKINHQFLWLTALWSKVPWSLYRKILPHLDHWIGEVLPSWSPYRWSPPHLDDCTGEVLPHLHHCTSLVLVASPHLVLISSFTNGNRYKGFVVLNKTMNTEIPTSCLTHTRDLISISCVYSSIFLLFLTFVRFQFMKYKNENMG